MLTGTVFESSIITEINAISMVDNNTMESAITCVQYAMGQIFPTVLVAQQTLMQICTDFVFVMKVTTVMVVRKVITHFLENVIHIVLAPVQAQRQKIATNEQNMPIVTHTTTAHATKDLEESIVIHLCLTKALVPLCAQNPVLALAQASAMHA